MKLIKVSVFSFLVLFSYSMFSQWQPAGDKLKTEWASELDPENILPEYPRPIMKREQWKNLNGLWDYSITDKNSAPSKINDGEILVPFAVESSLSGVMKRVEPSQVLWYKRNFTIPTEWDGQRINLNFGAVDWKADVWINDIKIGSHTGGYVPFSFDITPFLTKGEQEISVKVWDPTNEGPQPRGKQVREPEGIYYTPVTGIWQTVWLEPMNPKSFKKINFTPNIDNNTVKLEAETTNLETGDIIEVIVLEDDKEITRAKFAAGESLEILLEDPKLWFPETPFLYRTIVKLISNKETVDEVKSYFAMRKISKKRDENGIVRMQLNNEDYFHFGPLDQGWWPDGLYTAPTDEALKYDILKTKEMGYNMIRKHVKVEPARWYTHCDELGILVWQDMPSGDEQKDWQMRKYFEGNELVRSNESEEIFRKEWQEILDYLMPYPSIVVWVPFNEAWGQFKTKEITEWTSNYDSTRLINSASGGNHFQTGDILDLHQYPDPQLYLYDANRVTVLGEYGGIGFPMEDHLWASDKNWGYVEFKSSKEVTDKYIEYAETLKDLVRSGFSAAVYTQTTDVEGEVNGLMTYDRKKDKMNIKRIRKVNQEVINILKD
ncbi:MULTISPECIES: glycoside hydrolase family 2 protein [Salegentibacter]|uniref:Glycosyl hydrolases family 2, TIM barrel domain n=1 Tax=Salegentibacter agarivorans TaxID=345907 RepID=A0A1I2LUT3_9FLAO|nr:MULTISPECIES: sugar-binding domain-containing protein [Salegentibacter]APS37754.1 beta-galactosidase [Salegentibacter sp. T436]SFF82973.1 Glycosyl hydrolases family 2, TIM barrel domain [Salegentibacter agarivorans]